MIFSDSGERSPSSVGVIFESKMTGIPKRSPSSYMSTSCSKFERVTGLLMTAFCPSSWSIPKTSTSFRKEPGTWTRASWTSEVEPWRLISTFRTPSSRKRRIFSRVRRCPFEKIVTAKSSSRAFATISMKSLRRVASPPESERKRMFIRASCSRVEKTSPVVSSRRSAFGL